MRPRTSFSSAIHPKVPQSHICRTLPSLRLHPCCAASLSTQSSYTPHCFTSPRAPTVPALHTSHPSPSKRVLSFRSPLSPLFSIYFSSIFSKNVLTNQHLAAIIQRLCDTATEYGGIAQLGERLNGIQEVTGSIPVISTKEFQEPSKIKGSWNFSFIFIS